MYLYLLPCGDTLQYKHTCALSFCCNMKWFLCLTFNCNCLQHQLVGVAKDRNALLLQYPDYLELWRLGNTRKTSGINHALSHQFLQKSFDFKEFWKTRLSFQVNKVLWVLVLINMMIFLTCRERWGGFTWGNPSTEADPAEDKRWAAYCL